MKKIFAIITLSLILSCGTQDATSTAEATANIEVPQPKPPKISIQVSPVKFGTFEVMTQDLGAMTWDQANYEVSNLGNGWRLPNLGELNRLAENMQDIGGFVNGESYWSSELHLNDPYAQNFNIDWSVPHQSYGYRGDLNRVRAVRDLK